MNLEEKIRNRQAVIGIVGLGYVGLPLAIQFASKDFRVIGFDLDTQKIALLREGKSYIRHIPSDGIASLIDRKMVDPTDDFSRLAQADVIIICVPTPLNEHREPDLSFVSGTAETVAKFLRPGQLVSLESTTYPGTTRELLLPLFEARKLKVGSDFFLCFSPEREDPNNKEFKTANIPKLVGGCTPECLKLGLLLYDQITSKTVPVSSLEVAEAAKLLENIYRGVNVALVNELKVVFDRMGIDIWEVIGAASTKPFGFQPFYPGPGLGGHCIPVDPFYLTWRAREFGMHTKFIELAGEVNLAMPAYVVQKTADALNERKKSLKDARVLILGVAYKKDVDDMRESPSLKLIELFLSKGARVDYNDPFIPELPKTRKYHFKMKSVDIHRKNLGTYDAVVIATDHSAYDYKMIVESSQLVIDTHNKAASLGSSKVVKA
jgi:UDP-N-acetyl-D-glucosamine dehydrogenase